MNETFFVTLGPVAAIVAGIVTLSLFFAGLNYISHLRGRPGIVPFKGIIDEKKRANVFLDEGRSINGVRLIGFTGAAAAKGINVPYQFSSLAVFESENGKRYFVRPDAIKYIEEIEVN